MIKLVMTEAHKQVHDTQGKKANLDNFTQWCNDVYFSVSPIYTKCILFKYDITFTHPFTLIAYIVETAYLISTTFPHLFTVCI